jgi:cytidylate kinase
VKFYVDADPAQRARRRHEELAAAGVASDLRAIEEEIRHRDRVDTTRSDSPLRRAADAVHVDTTGLSPDQVVDRLLEVVESRRA